MKKEVFLILLINFLASGGVAEMTAATVVEADGAVKSRKEERFGEDSFNFFNDNDDDWWDLQSENMLEFVQYPNETLASKEAASAANKSKVVPPEVDIVNLYKNYSALSGFRGTIDPALLRSINKFWLQFDPPSRAQHLGLATVYLLMMVVGCLGNALVIFMFLRFRSLRTPANYLVANLAVSDFAMLCLGPTFVYNSYYQGPALPEIVCRLYGFVGGLTGVGSIATLTAISIDRYNVVVYPLHPRRASTKLRCKVAIVLIWLYSFAFSVVPLLDIGLSRYVPEGMLTACSFEYLDPSFDSKIFMFAFFVFAWAVPFAIIAYCYVFILRVVVTAGGIQSSRDKSKTEVKLALVVIGIIGLWFIAWTPYAIVALLGITGNERFLTPFGSMLPAVFCKISACANPYLYAVNHPRFRSEMRRLFGQPPEHRFSGYQTSFYSKASTIRRQTRAIGDVSTVTTSNNNRGKIPMRTPLDRGLISLDMDSSISEDTSLHVAQLDAIIMDHRL